MVEKKLRLIFKVFIIISILFINKIAFSDPNNDQWQDTNKSYKDLIEEGFEVKAYSMNTIETNRALKILLFVTVLQKNTEVYECQEYQTLNESIETLDMSLFCRQLVQPYKTGLGT